MNNNVFSDFKIIPVKNARKQVINDYFKKTRKPPSIVSLNGRIEKVKTQSSEEGVKIENPQFIPSPN